MAGGGAEPLGHQYSCWSLPYQEHIFRQLKLGDSVAPGAGQAPYPQEGTLGCTWGHIWIFPSQCLFGGYAGSWLPFKPRVYAEAQQLSSWPPVIFWEGQAGVRWGFTLFHPCRKIQGTGTCWGASFPCSIPMSPPWMEEMDMDGKHCFSQGFPWERAASRLQERNFGVTYPAAFTMPV